MRNQTLKLREMLHKHGCPDLAPGNKGGEYWQLEIEQGQCEYACFHVAVEQLTLLGAETEPRVVALLAEVAELAGVFINECPEHDKRRYWKENRPLALPPKQRTIVPNQTQRDRPPTPIWQR